MTSDGGRWELSLELLEYNQKTYLLCLSPCVCGLAIGIETTFITYADAMCVVSFAMSTNLTELATCLYRPVASHNIVVSNAVPSQFPVPSINLLCRTCLVGLDGRAMDDDFVDESRPPPNLLEGN